MRTVAFVLSLLFIFTLPWEEMILLGGFGTVGRLVGVILATLWAATVVLTNEIRKPRVFHAVFGLFVLWQLLSVFWTVDADETMRRLPAYVQLIGMVYIIWDLYRTPETVKWGLQAYVFGAFVSIASLISNYLSGEQVFYGRYSATGFDPNNIGIILALGIPPAWYLATAKTHGKLGGLLKFINYSYIPLAVLATFLTASRGALLATSVAIAYIFAGLSRLKLASRITIIALLFCTMYVLQPLIPEATLERLYTTGAEVETLDLNGRFRLWDLGLSAFAERPILGYGSFAFRATSDTHELAHNSFLTILVEVGLIGFTLFAILMGLVAYSAANLEKAESRLWLAMLLILTVGTFSLNWAHRKQFWLFPTMVVVASGLAVRYYSQSRSKDGLSDTMPAGAVSQRL